MNYLINYCTESPQITIQMTKQLALLLKTTALFSVLILTTEYKIQYACTKTSPIPISVPMPSAVFLPNAQRIWENWAGRREFPVLAKIGPALMKMQNTL